MPGLTDDQVATEMRKMTAFIKQEAQEKAREIEVKANEEFNIEKAKILRQETTNIEAAYQQKIKQLEISKKINISNQNNKARLELLELRDSLLDKVFEEARAKLASVSSDAAAYAKLIEELILQGLYTILEKDLVIAGRPQDKEVLETAAAAAVKAFDEKAGYDVTYKVETTLDEKSAGGVTITGYGNRIVVDNTLDQRLKLIEEKMLPEIRYSLYGANPNRKFFN